MTDLPSDADRLEEKLAATRTSMDRKLSELGDRLSPGKLLDDLMSYVKGSDGAAYANDLMASIRANPLPAALTGIGLAWLMASNTRPGTNGAAASTPSEEPHGYWRWRSAEDFDRHMEGLRADLKRDEGESDEAWAQRHDIERGRTLGIYRGADETHEGFRGRVESALNSAREAIGNTAQKVADFVSSNASAASTAAGDGARAVSDTANRLYSEVLASPVLLGATGLALGALLGAALPLSQTEEGVLKDAAKTVRKEAETLAQDAMDKGREVLGEAKDAALRSAEEHGIGTEKTVRELAAGVRDGRLVEDLKDVAKKTLGAMEIERTDGQGQQQGQQRKA